MTAKKKLKPASAKKLNQTVPSQKGSKPSNQRPAKDQKLKEELKATRLANKLLTIKRGLESGDITTFEGMFVSFSPTRLGKLIGFHFYSFDEKLADPGKFTYNDMIRLSNLLKVDFAIINNFIYRQLKSPQRKTEERHKLLYHTD